MSDLAGTKKPFVLPVPFMNVLNGGSHAGGRLAFQEFMIVPEYGTAYLRILFCELISLALQHHSRKRCAKDLKYTNN